MAVQDKVGLRVVHGHRYEVWNGTLSCDRARQLVPEMTRTRTAAKLLALTVDGMKCRVAGAIPLFRRVSAKAIYSLAPTTARGQCRDDVRAEHFSWWPAMPR